MADHVVSLAVERARINELWPRIREAHVALADAAAFAFHQIHDGADGIVSLEGYRNDLNVVAAALSRLTLIYTLIDDDEGRVQLPVDLGRQRFANGAAELHCVEDGFFFTRLSILRADAPSAIALMKVAGLPLTCEFYPVVAAGRERAPGSG